MMRILFAFAVIALFVSRAWAADEPAPNPMIPPPPDGIYYIDLSLIQGDKLLATSQMKVLEGFTADVRSERWRYPGVYFPYLVVIDAGAQHMRDRVLAPQAIIDAMEIIKADELTFKVYCPGATRFKADIYWSSTAHHRDSPHPLSDVKPEPVDVCSGDWCYVGCVEAALSGLDLGVVDPGDYLDPQLRSTEPAGGMN